jgi:hypothetical protein
VTSGRAKRRQPRPGNSYGKRYITFAKESTARAPPSRPSRSDSRRLGGLESRSRHRLLVQSGPPSEPRHPRVAGAAAGRHRGGPVPRGAHSNAKAAAPPREAPCHARPKQPRVDGHPHRGVRRRAARHGRGGGAPRRDVRVEHREQEWLARSDTAEYTQRLSGRAAARTLCNLSLRTASGPEGSSAKQSLTCAAGSSGSRWGPHFTHTIFRVQLQGSRPQVAPAAVR